MKIFGQGNQIQDNKYHENKEKNCKYYRRLFYGFLFFHMTKITIKLKQIIISDIKGIVAIVFESLSFGGSSSPPSLLDKRPSIVDLI
jgi:hypothetical protein